MKALLLLSIITFTAHAQIQEFGNLKDEEQKFFKNDQMDGNNKLERIDANVKEINKLHGEIAKLKSEMAKLKEEVAALKSGKK